MFALSACTHFTFQHKDQKVYVSSPESSKQYCFDHPKYVLTGLRVFELHYIAKKRLDINLYKLQWFMNGSWVKLKS